MEHSQSKPVEKRKTSFLKDKFYLLVCAIIGSVIFLSPLINGMTTGEIVGKVFGFSIIVLLFSGVLALVVGLFGKIAKLLK